MSALGGPRDGGGPPARALLPALQTRATPRRCPRTSTVDHDQSPSTATARSLEYPSVTTDEAQLKIRASVPTGAASNTTREDADTPTTPTTGIHATDQLLVSTTPYYAHLYPLLLRARGALQDLDRTPQEPGHYNDYHDTTTGIHATDQLLVSTTPYYAHLYPLLLRARGALQDLDRTPQEPGHYNDYHDTTTGIHATDQLLVSTTPYYAHLYPLLLRARGALQDLDRTPQEPGHYNDYHDTTTGIHATDQLLVSTTPYYAHLYPLLLRARGALQDLDRTPQEPGHYNDYHDTTTGIHATDQLLVSTTPYYAHLYPLLLRARGALQDLDRTPQEPGHYNDYHDTTTGIHATDQLLVSTTPYYAHLYPLLLRARGALQDLDRTPQEPGHYNDYHDTTTGIHATDQLLVSTTPYYAHLYPLLLRARGALQDLDRTPQEPGHYNDYHDTTTGIHATDQLLVSTTPYYAHLYPLLLRARGALQDLDRTPQEPGHYNDYHDTTTGIHATDQLLVSTTPYYAHLYPLLLRARGALQDLDRTPQEPGHYDDDHDRHPRNGPAPCLDDALLRAPLPPSTSRERSTARLGPHPAGARSLQRLPRLTRKYWAAPYTSSLLPRSRARARCGLGAFAPGPAAHVLASR